MTAVFGREFLEIVVNRKDALHVEFRAGRLGLESLHDFADVGHNLLHGCIGRQIVGADQQEEFLGVSLDDRIEPVEHPTRTVAADAAVLDAGIGQQLVPLAAVGDAVAQKDDVLRGYGQLLEERATLEIVLALREDGGCGNQQHSRQNQFFHYRR